MLMFDSLILRSLRGLLHLSVACKKFAFQLPNDRNDTFFWHDFFEDNSKADFRPPYRRPQRKSSCIRLNP